MLEYEGKIYNKDEPIPVSLPIKKGTKAYTLTPIGNLEKQLKDVRSRVSDDRELPGYIKTNGNGLKHQLHLLGYVITSTSHRPVQSMNLALQYMGYDVKEKPTISWGEVMHQFRKHLPMELCERAYRGEIGKVAFRKIMYKTEEGKRAYRAVLNKRKKGHDEWNMPRVINNMWPSLTNKYGKPLYDMFMPPRPAKAQTKQHCIDEFFKGEIISKDGFTSNGGKSIAYAMHNPKGQQFEYPKFVETAVRYLKSHPGLDKITAHDIISDITTITKSPKTFMFDTLGRECNMEDGMEIYNINANKELSRITELQTYFMFNILTQYDSQLSGMDELRSMLGGNIIDFFHNQEWEGMAFRNKEIFGLADGRFMVGDLSDYKTLALEIKAEIVPSKQRTRSMIKKYKGRPVWHDNESLDGRLAVLYSHNGRVKEREQMLKDAGWKVLLAEEMTDIYSKTLDMLLENDPDFFDTKHGPAVDKDILLDIHQMLYRYQHPLLRRGHRFTRRWMHEVLDSANKHLFYDGERMPVNKFEHVHRKPFEAFRCMYGSQIDISIPDTLFLDLETASLSGKSTPLVVLGMAYQQGSKMYSDMRLIRNPLEEKKVLKDFLQFSKRFKKIVTFNGRGFDIPFLKSRCIANHLPYTLDMEHIDIYDHYKERSLKTDDTKLQTLERAVLGVSRKNDLEGKKVPLTAYEFWIDNNPKIEDVINHCHPDVISPALLYKRILDEQVDQ